jgi:hypothetical protein
MIGTTATSPGGKRIEPITYKTAGFRPAVFLSAQNFSARLTAKHCLRYSPISTKLRGALMNLPEKLATACRILAMQGHNDMIYGHVSALTETPGQYWIKRLRRQHAGGQTKTPQRISDSQRSVPRQPGDSLRDPHASDLFDDHRVIGAPPAADHQFELCILSAGHK